MVRREGEQGGGKEETSKVTGSEMRGYNRGEENTNRLFGYWY